MGCSATAGRLRLGSLGLESDALGSPSALWARDHDNQLFRGLGQRRVWAKTARGTLDCLDFGDGRDYLVDGSCSRRQQLERACRTSRTLLARARTRAHTTSEQLSSRGSDEGVSSGEIDSERLTSSCRGRAHGTLVVPAIVARRTPRLLMSLGMMSRSSTRRVTLTSFDESKSWWSRGGPHSLSHAVGGISERILIIFLVSSHETTLARSAT
jgi:hypothetical protein